MSKYTLRPYPIYIETTDPIPYGARDIDIEAVFSMPKVGKRICFGEAWKMAMEWTARHDLDFAPFQKGPITKWIAEQGYYIEFDDGELEFIPGNWAA